MPFYEAYMQTSRPGSDDTETRNKSIVKKNKMSTGSRAAAVLAFFGFVFGTGALVLVLIIWVDPSIPIEFRRSIGRDANGAMNTQSSNPSVCIQNKTWLFAVGGSWPPYHYINRDGELAGMEIDLVKQVCAASKKDCRLVLYNDNVCWSSKTSTSEALNNRFVDACLPWYETKTAKLVYEFTVPHIQQQGSYFYISKDSNITSIKDTHRIGFSSASFASPQCLKSLARPLKPKQIVYADSVAELKSKLSNKEVDAIFLPEDYASGVDFKKLGSALGCSIGGAAVMHREDTSMAWFREGFRSIINDEKYSRICKKTYDGVQVRCIEKPL